MSPQKRSEEEAYTLVEIKEKFFPNRNIDLLSQRFGTVSIEEKRQAKDAFNDALQKLGQEKSQPNKQDA